MNVEEEDRNVRRVWFVYDACRLAAMAANAPVVPPPFNQRSEAFKEQFVRAVVRQFGPSRLKSPKEAHNAWWNEYIQLGWKYGEEYDPERKTHPDMVEYEKLPMLEREKDEIFLALCNIARKYIK